MFRPVDPNPNFAKLEEAILKFWEKEKIFEKSLEATKSGKPFTFYDGPPFATGLPHYGHILVSTIKDLMPRYQTMNGRFVRRRWGWDCHGLPIEEIVERKLGISGKKQIEKIGIRKFNETCRSMVLQYAREWGKMVRRIARWVDFENSYKTMDREYMESVWWAFKQFYDKGLVYEGRKVLLYCPRCETPVSNFEVAMDNSYKDVTEEAVTVKFKVKGKENTYLLAWTTTPWTLVGNVALAVREDIDYAVVEKDGENYIAAKDTLLFVMPDLIRHPGNNKLDSGSGAGMTVLGKDLVGLEYEPLFPVPAIAAGKGVYQVYAADFVNTAEGTGIVHTAVVYGEDDYNLGLREGLPVVPLLDERGYFNEKAPELVRGQYFKKAEKAVKEDLEKRGLMFEKKMHQHSYPHCWRCGTALFYNAIPAWFINIQKIKPDLLRSNEKEINWFPEHLKFGRYQKSVEQAPDWNISRNRYWGNPIPVWRCNDCKKDTVVGSIEELEKKSVIARSQQATKQSHGHGIAAARTGGPRNDNGLDLHRPHIDDVVLKCQHCGGEARRITEIFDSWFEAGSMPFASVHYPFTPPLSPPNLGGESGGVENKFIFPAQFVTEYIAQTRAWFYVMHVVSLVLFGKAPFENVLTTGTILAADGSKMSKSKNNFPDPWDMINKYGVDSLRFYLMNSVVMDADNLNFSEKDLGTVNRKVFRILWNVYNYFVSYANEAGYTPLLSPPKLGGEGRGILDTWILARMQEVTNNVTKYLDGYNTVRATREIGAFIDDLSTWYLRRSRGRQDQAFFDTMSHVLITLSKLLAPVAPFMAEEIYRNLNTPPTSPPNVGGEGRGISVHLERWPEAKKLTKEQEGLLKQMAELRKVVEEAHALRAKAGIKLRQPLERLVIPKNLSRPSATPSSSGEGNALSAPPLERGGIKGEVEEGLLDILKDEVNVKEIVFGDKLELDTTLTSELKQEGLVRELERAIQSIRKEQGLKIGEMAKIQFATDSKVLRDAMGKVDKKKVYATELRIVNGEWSEGKEVEVDGEKIKIKISMK